MLSDQDVEALRCSVDGLNGESQWEVRGFYDNEFNDPFNFDLNENTVSLITAIATSVSLVLFSDIMFRALVRARNGEVSKQVVFRRHVFDGFSNPITLAPNIFRNRNTAVSCSSKEDETGIKKLRSLNANSKRTYAALVLMGLLTAAVEFLFIFLATNQNSASDVRLEGVPVFEFEDRGCDFVNIPILNGCSQVPLTEKPGFNSRAVLQICSSSVVRTNNDTLGLHNTFMAIAVDLHSVLVLVNYRGISSEMWYRIGLVNENRATYRGRYNGSVENIQSAFLSRLERTNVTVLDTVPGRNDEVERETLQKVERRLSERRTDMMQESQVLVAGFVGLVDAVDLRETYLNVILSPGATIDEARSVMDIYLHGLVRSVMFPTAKERGIFPAGNFSSFLEEDETPLVYYNRPWIGVAPSLCICGILFLIWVVLVALGIESGVDSRWAWKEFFEDTTTIEDFGRGNDEALQAHWRRDCSGVESFGFTPRT
ncbi:hypothetical protein FGB62_52g11 [Gracilaria domingensis]|nr:hypothetical protein FGB62_52g11 [Gracilaria domingensis]